jgi:hypothetical protein
MSAAQERRPLPLRDRHGAGVVGLLR